MANASSFSSGSLDPQQAFAQLGRIVLGAEPLSVALGRVAELAKQTIPGLVDVSVTLIGDRKAETVAFTGPLAVQLDERQYEAGFGPCTDAAMSGQTIVVATDDPGTAYPGFSAVCQQAGVAHVVSIGLPVAQRTVGGLNLYAATVEPIESTAVDLAEGFAGYAAVAVANAALYQSTADLAGQMQAAMVSRAVIEQAKGVVMEREHITDGEAFAMLAKTSQHSNRKLRDVAAAVVASTQQTRR